jgi:nucleoside-diphosphate-sugar epimerase
VKVLVSGGAGVLGSSLVHMLLEKGFKVKVVDIQRVEEAWRLRDVLDRVEYVWKSSWDLDAEDLEGSSIVFDCGLLFADRPFSIHSPTHAFIDNMMPPLRLLEAARKLKDKPVVCYASSFNSLYGYPKGTIFHERLLPCPNNPYGLTKASAELTYLCYARCFKLPVVITRVGSAYGEGGRCYDEKTEVLTNVGWKKFYELKGDELVYTLNPETGEILLQPIKRIYKYDYEGKMYHIHNSFIDLLVTPGHKIFFKPYDGKPRLAPIEEMLGYSYVVLFNTGKWKGQRRESISFKYLVKSCKRCGYIGKYVGAREPRCSRCKSRRVEILEREESYPMEDFLKFFGFWLGDGGLGKAKSNEVIISQTKEKEREEILDVCRRLFRDSTITVKRRCFIIHNKNVYRFLTKLGKKQDRYIPNEMKTLSSDLLSILIEWYCKADGTDYGSKYNIYTSNPRMRDDLMEIALKAGYSARYTVRPKGRASYIEGRKVVQKLDNYQISITKEIGNDPVLEVKKISHGHHEYKGIKTWIREVNYKGNVYCIEVPEHHIIYVRRNGKPIWSGNSDELPHRLIIYGLKGRRFRLRSPHAKRLWTYSEDIMRFYDRLVEKIREAAEFELPILHSAGNRGDVITSNVQLAELIRRFIPSLEYEAAEYEPGEEHVDFKVESRFTRNFLGWTPIYSLEEGLQRTVEWFKRNIERYV